jgi:bifunctional non-homologous end joining protein LigD
MSRLPRAHAWRRGTDYSAFDILWLNGRDLRGLRYIERKKILRRFVATRPAIGYVAHFSDPALFTAAAKLYLEGVVSKRADDPYVESTE